MRVILKGSKKPMWIFPMPLPGPQLLSKSLSSELHTTTPENRLRLLEKVNVIMARKLKVC